MSKRDFRQSPSPEQPEPTYPTLDIFRRHFLVKLASSVLVPAALAPLLAGGCRLGQASAGRKPRPRSDGGGGGQPRPPDGKPIPPPGVPPQPRAKGDED